MVSSSMVSLSKGAGPVPRASPLSARPFDQEMVRPDHCTSRLSDVESDLRRYAWIADVERMDGSAATRMASNSIAARAVRALTSRTLFRRMVRMNCRMRWSIMGGPLFSGNNTTPNHDFQQFQLLRSNRPTGGNRGTALLLFFS